MTEAFDLTAEANWEVEGTRRAIAAYRRAASAMPLDALPPGRKLLREIVPGLKVRIEAAQREAEVLVKARAAASGGGNGAARRGGAWIMLLLPADILALLTTITVLRAAEPRGDPTAASLPSTIDELVKAIRDEVEYRTWAAEPTHETLLKRLRKAYPNLNRGVWCRWRRKVEALRIEKWPRADCIHFGAQLIALLVETSEGRFVVDTRTLEGGRTQKYVRLSEECLQVLQDVSSRAEVARPRLMPMICAPIPWQYV